MKSLRITLLTLVAIVAQAQDAPNQGDYTHGVILATRPGLRAVVQVAGTQYRVTVHLACAEPPASALHEADRELSAYVGKVVEATSSLFTNAEVEGDLIVLRAETHPTFRNYRMQDETEYVPSGETLISHLVSVGLVTSPVIGGELGEVYASAWQSAMRSGTGYWSRNALPRNTWIVPIGAERTVESFWNGGR